MSALGNLDSKPHVVVLGGANDVERAEPVEHKHHVFTRVTPAADEQMPSRQ
jgi:hypothetical protein